MGAIVQAPCGGLEGLAADTSGVHAFLGVPYAAPPVGELRWKPPQQLEPWSGTRKATAFAWRCIQHAPYGELEPDSPGMREDCLYLNVWTPDTSARLPVIFWIHGGEFWAGSGSEPRYNGARLAARGAVVVTFNHRLGVFGFLSHPELSAEGERGTSGNYGLLDQIAALEWTRANIAAFGGDPDKITVAGESAGSCSVSFLMASPLSKHLFHRAVGESCAYFMPEPHTMKPLPHAENEQRGVEFVQVAGAAALAELRALDGEKLFEIWRKPFLSKRMQPCVDGYIFPDVADVFRLGQQANVPLLVGWNGDEYGFLRAIGEKFNSAAFQKRLASSFGEDGAGALLAAYGMTPLEASTDIASDRAMVWPTWQWAEEHAKRAPVFVYRFDRPAPGRNLFGATHASEIEYVFSTLDSKSRSYAQEDHALSKHMGDYWVNFARSGDPNASGSVHWPPYGKERVILHLDAEIAAKPLRAARLELLSSLFAKRGHGQPVTGQ
jgi:para-nitrobenzyl esterase